MPGIEEVRRLLQDLIGDPDTPFMTRRAQSARFAESFVKPSNIEIAGGVLGGVPAEWVVADDADPSFVFFHLHGGGYVLGDPAGSRTFTSAFAERARCRVVSIDYRLAPEYPFPAAVDDALDAYRALLDSTAAHNIAIGGESAGGGLAVATLLAARAHGLAMPASLIALSPWTDMRCQSGSFISKAGLDPLLTRRALREMADAYVEAKDMENPLASPALGDLAGLPPMLIHAGSDEVLLDDARALQIAAQSAGIESRLKIWPQMIHVWHMFHPMLQEGAEAIDELAAFVREKWDGRVT
jgi:acetyl esterase/lipase